MRNNRGFTIVECVMAMALISVALMALMSTILSSMTLVEVNRQDALVMNVVRDKMAEITGYPFSQVYNNYYGQKFDVFNAGDQAGQVLFPVNNNGNLDETIPDSLFRNAGMPRDMNMDGDANDQNVNTKYKILPIKLRVSWTTVQGDRVTEFNTILSSLK